MDVPQDFAQASSFQVRDELEDLVRRDLLGPWDGEREEFAPKAMGPRERYLVGMLGPKQRDQGAGDATEVDAHVQGDGNRFLDAGSSCRSTTRTWRSFPPCREPVCGVRGGGRDRAGAARRQRGRGAGLHRGVLARLAG